MNFQDTRLWEIAAGATLAAGLTTLGVLWMRRKRPTPEEIEIARRVFLTQSGRIVDGTLLDVCEVPTDDGVVLTMLLYEYRIGGVDYQCSQDITRMGETINVAHVRTGLPCSVRYQPGNPQNSMVVAEKWSGLRVTIPLYDFHARPVIDS